MEELFLTHNIHKTIVICDTDDTCLRTLQQLIDDEHTVSYISYDHLLDERGGVYQQRLRSFQSGSSRVLLMSYRTWHEIIDALEEHAMDHNLLVMTQLEDQEKYVIMGWIMDARSRGFIRDSRNYHIFFWDESFSVLQE